MPPTTSPGLPRRLAALVYDTLLVLPMIMLAVGLATLLQVALLGGEPAGDFTDTLPPWLVQALTLLTVIGFYTYFWTFRGQTLGMQAWRIELRGFDGGTIDAPRAVLRCLAACLSLLPAGLGFWWCLVDRRGRYWHDYLSRSELRLLPKQRD